MLQSIVSPLRPFLLTLLVAIAADVSAVTIKVRVMDNFTQLPISGAELSLERVSGKTISLVEKFSFSATGTLQFDLPDKESTYQFEVQAPDYGAHQSPRFTAATTSPLYDLQLPRQKDFEGAIVAPTGQLASGARYFLCTDLTEVTFRPDKTFFTRSRVPETSRDAGKLRLSPEPTGHSILAAHELGYGFAPLFGWTNGTVIKLKPWARIAGRMLINGVIAPNQRLSLEATETALGGTKMTFLNFDVITDKQGRFAFENVPPGQVYILWKIPSNEGRFVHSHRTLIDADPFQSDEIDFNLVGRNITGVFQADVQQKDWSGYRILGYLMTKPDGVPLELWKPNAGLTPSQTRHFAVMVNEQLRLSATAIPPGDYTVRLYAIDESQNNTRPSHFSFQGQLQVPKGAEAIDLGPVVVTNAAPVARN